MRGKLFRGNLVAMLGLLVTGISTPAQGQAKPDLVVSGVQVENDVQGFVSKVTVKVTNVCRQSSAGASYVLVSFKQSAEKTAKTILFIGNTVQPLKGAESFMQSFPITEMKIGSGRHILIEVDPYNKVAEANESNNWWKLNPDSKPASPSGQYQCTSKS